MDQLAQFIPLLAIVLVFWLLIIRPASRRQKQVARLQAGLGVGDRVLLSSGIYATIRGLADDRVEAEISDGVVVQVARGAVAAVDRPADEPVVDRPVVDEPGTPEPGSSQP